MRKRLAVIGVPTVCLGLLVGCRKAVSSSTSGGGNDSRSSIISHGAGGAGNPPKSSPSGKAQLGVAQNARTHVELYQQTLAVTKELAELLASVKDEASAKAAKLRFEQLQDEAIACAQRMQQLGGHPAGIGDPYLPDIKRYTQQLQTEWQRIYADPAAKSALGKLRI